MNTALALRYDEASDMAPDLLRDVILPSDVLSSSDCDESYRLMFVERVESLLAREHPALRAALGDELFAQLARDYLATSAVSAHVLTKAGEGLPDYLGGSRMLDRESAGWVADLARLERAIARASVCSSEDALGPEALESRGLQGWESARVEPVESLELHAFDHRVDEAYDAWLQGQPLTPPRARPQLLAVVRQGTQVQRITLSRQAWLVLSGLCLGRPLALALFDALGPAVQRSAQLRAYLWMRAWVANGFFKAVHLGGGNSPLPVPRSWA